MSNRNLSEPDTIVRAVTVIMGAVVGLTFLFGFGNVLNLALRLGVPPWVAPLVGPAVDLSIIGLLLGTRYLAINGATADQLRPARRLLIFSSLVTLALNVAEPIIAGQLGKAAFDAVGPLLLIGWAEIGPGLLAALAAIAAKSADSASDEGDTAASEANAVTEWHAQRPVDEDLLNRARQEDLQHWRIRRRPISSDTLRRRLHVGAGKARGLVAIMRSEYPIRSNDQPSDVETTDPALVEAA